jgi:hypothetical protein
MAAATLSTVQKNIRSLPAVYGGLVNTITGFAMSTNATWPYVYYPFLKENGEHIREITKVSSTVFVPIVTDPNAWTAFTQATSPIPVSPVIFQVGMDGEMSIVTEPGQYFPIWQIDLDREYSNGLEDMFINMDYGSTGFIQSINFVNATNQPIFSLFLPTLKVDDIALAAASKELADKFIPQDDPRSAYTQPIHATLDEGASVVGYTQATISWSKYFNNVLLKRSDNIYCVVSNNYGQVHTWSVNQTGSSYVGEVSSQSLEVKPSYSLFTISSNA